MERFVIKKRQFDIEKEQFETDKKKLIENQTTESQKKLCNCQKLEEPYSPSQRLEKYTPSQNLQDRKIDTFEQACYETELKNQKIHAKEYEIKFNNLQENYDKDLAIHQMES